MAVTGLLLVGFLIAHLAGNLFIYGGAGAYNKYAETLHSVGPALWLLEIGLLLLFLVHIVFTVTLVLENWRARGTAYAVNPQDQTRSWTTRTMPYTGTFLLVYICFHLYDYHPIFKDHEGPASILNGVNQGLYGLVCHSFLNPVRSGFYLIAMGVLGFHLAHGISSLFQTCGIVSPERMPVIHRISLVIGIFFAMAFGSIPIYVLIQYGGGG